MAPAGGGGASFYFAAQRIHFSGPASNLLMFGCAMLCIRHEPSRAYGLARCTSFSTLFFCVCVCVCFICVFFSVSSAIAFFVIIGKCACVDARFFFFFLWFPQKFLPQCSVCAAAAYILARDWSIFFFHFKNLLYSLRARTMHASTYSIYV